MYIAEKSNHRIRKVTVATSNPRYVDNSILSNFYYFFDFNYKFNFSSPSPTVVPTVIPTVIPTIIPTVVPTVTPTTATPSVYYLDIITTIAGTGTSSYSGDNGAATSATLNSPTGVAVDASGRILWLLSAALLPSN